MLRLALVLLHLGARGANAMPKGEDAAWAAAWAHAGVTPRQVEELRVDVIEGGWRVTVRGASFVVAPPRDQAAREDVAALVASAYTASVPAQRQAALPAPADAPASAFEASGPAGPTDGAPGAPPTARAWTSYGLLETGVRLWPARATVPSHALTVGLEGTSLCGEVTALITTPASIWEAGAGRAQTVGRLAVAVGADTPRVAVRFGIGAEGSRFADGPRTVEVGALPDASVTLRGRPLVAVPLLVGGTVFRSLGTTRLTLAPDTTTQLSPWRLGLSVAYALNR